MSAHLIKTWLAADFETQIDAVLNALGIEHRPDDPDAANVVALELGLIDGDGDAVVIDEQGEVSLRTERAQILRNIEVASERGDRSISELVETGEIRRAELRDETQI